MSDEAANAKQARLAWGAVVVVAVAGYFSVLSPAERQLEGTAARAHELYDLAERNEQVLRGSAALGAARDRVARDVAHLTGRQGSATLQTLRLLDDEASRLHVTVGGLTPDGSLVRGSGSQSVTIALHGAYRNVILTIADMSQHAALLEVGGAMLAPIAESDDREIDATVRATMYYQLEGIMKEHQGVGTDAR